MVLIKSFNEIIKAAILLEAYNKFHVSANVNFNKN